MSKFKKHYKIIEEQFTDLKERIIINEIINQSNFQKTDKPLIEQTYLAKICGCSRMTIHRTLKRLKGNEWVSYKMVLNKKGYTTTQITINDKLKELRKEIGVKNKTIKCAKQKVINSVIPNFEGILSVDNVNF